MNTQQHINAFKSYMNYRRYSQNMIKTYSDALDVFFRFFQKEIYTHVSTQNLQQIRSPFDDL